jgi:hypothetical protein
MPALSPSLHIFFISHLLFLHKFQQEYFISVINGKPASFTLKTFVAIILKFLHSTTIYHFAATSMVCVSHVGDLQTDGIGLPAPSNHDLEK